MPITRQPNPLRSALNFVPSGGTAYKVANDDSFYGLADRPEVKASGMSANDLCFFNFKTRNPPEINWYLYNKVGAGR